MAELIVIKRSQVTKTEGETTAAPVSSAGTDELNQVCERLGLTPLFSEECSDRWDRRSERPVCHPRQFLRTTGDRANLEELAQELSKYEGVQLAYVTPEAWPPGLVAGGGFEPPSFEDTQRYLDAPEIGIGARTAKPDRTPAHDVEGGSGADVRVLDIEGSWNFDHEDLDLEYVRGTLRPEPIWRNHGTAVAGIICATPNGFGVTGIVPEAQFLALSVYDGDEQNLVLRIGEATKELRAGDVMLIELQAPGPAGKNIAMEYWPHVYLAIRDATELDIIVVEAAGNGGLDLDSVMPLGDINPFTADGPSGAVVVGAGVEGTAAKARERWVESALESSNFGSRIDAQGWGALVTTTGYGDLSLPGENGFYTAVFSGTSSAAAIVAGAIASLQGQRRARGLAPLTPSEVREFLRTTGSPQTGNTAENIGSLPDISAAAAPNS